MTYQEIQTPTLFNGIRSRCTPDKFLRFLVAQRHADEQTPYQDAVRNAARLQIAFVLQTLLSGKPSAQVENIMRELHIITGQAVGASHLDHCWLCFRNIFFDFTYAQFDAEAPQLVLVPAFCPETFRFYSSIDGIYTPNQWVELESKVAV